VRVCVCVCVCVFIHIRVREYIASAGHTINWLVSADTLENTLVRGQVWGSSILEHKIDGSTVERLVICIEEGYGALFSFVKSRLFVSPSTLSWSSLALQFEGPTAEVCIRSFNLYVEMCTFVCQYVQGVKIYAEVCLYISLAIEFDQDLQIFPLYPCIPSRQACRRPFTFLFLDVTWLMQAKP